MSLVFVTGDIIYFFGNGLIDDVIAIGWTDSDFRISRALSTKFQVNLFFFLFFFLFGFLRPFHEYFTYIEPIIHQKWAKTEEPGEKPPDHL